MKKVVILIICLFLIIVFIGLFFAQKETALEILTQTNKHSKQTEIISTTTPVNNQSVVNFTLDFERKVNEGVKNLTQNLKPDINKSLSQYRQEVLQIQQKFNIPTDTQAIDPEIFINIAQELAKINPPSLVYSLHLELIKIYYTLGLAFKELQTTNDPQKKILLYNIIKATLEKIKF